MIEPRGAGTQRWCARPRALRMAEPEPESVENPVEPSTGPPPDDVVVPDHKSDDASYIADP